MFYGHGFCVYSPFRRVLRTGDTSPFKTKVRGEKHLWFSRSDTPEHAAFDERTPGQFKEEYSGDGIVALYSKTYYCFGHSDKFSCQVVNKKFNDINKSTYMDVLFLERLLCYGMHLSRQNDNRFEKFHTRSTYDPGTLFRCGTVKSLEKTRFTH